VKWMRLSCHGFIDNQVRLQLFVVASEHGELLPPDGTAEKREALDDEGVTEKVIKIGAKVVRDAQ